MAKRSTGTPGWWRSSLPPLDGAFATAGLAAPVEVVRDAFGVPTIIAATRTDVAVATGFAHAQDRFFQMDLLRRRATGRSAELLGPTALDADRTVRIHGFARIAAEIYADLPDDQRYVLEAYARGVKRGLATITTGLWEYDVLGVEPEPWQGSDSLLVIHALWSEIGGGDVMHERAVAALERALGHGAADAFLPTADGWDAALDGSASKAAPMPDLDGAALTSEAGTARRWPDDLGGGSNAFAVDGLLTGSGSALLANDMHLGLGLPFAFYRAAFDWLDDGQRRFVCGVTLPGLPLMLAGSNGHLAWGLTNAKADGSDAVVITTRSTDPRSYRTPDGWSEIEVRTETFDVRGGPSVSLEVRSTLWGPAITQTGEDGRFLALRWVAHDRGTVDLLGLRLETSNDVDDGASIVRRWGFPHLAVVLADDRGEIAWAVSGRIPRRVGLDGRAPRDWATDGCRWDGWVQPDDMPLVDHPRDGVIWAANQRPLGGDRGAMLGLGPYANGARACQIRDRLLGLVSRGGPVTERDLLAVSLDDRAVLLAPWREWLIEVLRDASDEGHPMRAAMLDAGRTWTGRASVDSVAYRIVRTFHDRVFDRALGPICELAGRHDSEIDWPGLPLEAALAQLVRIRPVALVGGSVRTWEALLLAAADDVASDITAVGAGIDAYRWGARNVLDVEHPLASFAPDDLRSALLWPPDELPGDQFMPRVQAPRFGAGERLVVSPGHEADGIFHMPGGQSGHPASPFYLAGHQAWVHGKATPFLPGVATHSLSLMPIVS